MVSRLIACLGAVMVLPLCGGLMSPILPRNASAQAESPAWSAIDVLGPAARWGRTLAADPETGTLIVFGGYGNAGPLADFWMFDAAGDAT